VTTTTPTSLLDRCLVLHPQVALRPEPFGALAYHYGNRKLVFLRHPDIVRVVSSLDEHDTLSDTLHACDIAENRWPSFERALLALTASEMLHDRTG
jgi:putative mycofactocin binding protein MftB